MKKTEKKESPIKNVVILVTGGRDFSDADFLNNIFDYYHEAWNIIEVISGGASGADALAEKWAVKNNVKLSKYPADWKKFGKQAGVVRNVEMVDKNKDKISYVFAFKGGAGTEHCKKHANRRGLKIIEFTNGVVETSNPVKSIFN